MALLREAFKTLLRFVDLTDVPPYTGAALRLLRVNATTNAIEYVVPGNAYQLDHGTAAGNLVRLDNNARLPAIDGSALTNISVSDGLKGDITVTGNTWTINAGAVSLTDIAALPQQTLLGNAGSGNAAITLGTGLSLTGNTLNATATGGVTSVGLSLPSIFTVSNSPVTTTGTLTATLASQGARTVLIAPATSGEPTFRLLVAADIPNLPGSIINSGVIAPAHLGTGTANANTVLHGDGVFREPGVGGTVTSVGLSLPSIFTVSNSPITTSGTLTATLANQTANTVFASSGGAPTFRSLEVGDIPNLPGSQITTGIVAPERLGTGTASANTVLHGDGVWRGTAIAVQEDSISLTNAVSSINFTGAGVTASNTGNAVTVSIPGGGGGSSNVVEVITATSTLSRRLDATYLVNTSGGAITLTLPSNPENNDIVEVGDYGNTFSSFPLSILPNTGQLLLGGTTALLLDRNRQAIRLIFNGGRWSALNTTLEQFTTFTSSLTYLIQNPSFELPTISNNTFSDIGVLAGWTAPDNRIARGNGGGYNPPTPFPNGNQVLVFQVVTANTAASISQTISLPVNCLAMRVSFSHSRRNFAGTVTHRIHVLVNNTIVGVVEPTTDFNWVAYTTPWFNVSPGSSINLVIRVTQIGSTADHSTFLDNVQLEGQFTTGIVGNIPLSVIAVLPITNGNYQLPVIPDNTSTTTGPTGWTTTSTGTGAVNNWLTTIGSSYSPPTPAPDGNQVVVLQTLLNNGVQLIEQVIPIPQNCTFIRISFQYARRNQGYIVNQTIDTIVNGVIVGSISPNSIYTWNQFTTAWVAVNPGTNITLGIRATASQSTDYTTFIDSVVVEGQFSSLPYNIGDNITRLINSNTTLDAARRQTVLANTSSGIITLTLPAQPINGDIVQITDFSNTSLSNGFATNQLTVAANTGHNIVGNTNLLLNKGGQAVELVFHSNRWSITSGIGW